MRLHYSIVLPFLRPRHEFESAGIKRDGRIFKISKIMHGRPKKMAGFLCICIFERQHDFYAQVKGKVKIIYKVMDSLSGFSYEIDLFVQGLLQLL